MKPDTLERLLIDRAVGELPPDVAELVDAWIAHDPSAAESAAALGDTLGVARRALGPPERRDLLPLCADPGVLPFPLAAPEVRRAGPRPRVAALTAVAACVAGLAAGRLWERGHGPGASGAGETGRGVVAASTPATSPAAAPSPATGFWSKRRLRGAVASAAPDGEPRLLWKSPVCKPEIVTPL